MKWFETRDLRFEIWDYLRLEIWDLIYKIWDLRYLRCLNSFIQLLPWGVERNSFKKHPSLWRALLGNLFHKISDIQIFFTKIFCQIVSIKLWDWIFVSLDGFVDLNRQHSQDQIYFDRLLWQINWISYQHQNIKKSVRYYIWKFRWFPQTAFILEKQAGSSRWKQGMRSLIRSIYFKLNQNESQHLILISVFPGTGK